VSQSPARSGSYAVIASSPNISEATASETEKQAEYCVSLDMDSDKAISAVRPTLKETGSQRHDGQP
jgi:hypothetical protein